MNWQKIETAPKDGTWILVYTMGGDPDFAVCQWDGRHWNLLVEDERHDIGDGWYGAVTHWSPLPSPPETE